MKNALIENQGYEMLMVDSVSIGLIGVILTGIGVGIAIFFNIRATKQNTKSHLYQIIRDLESRFHEVESIPKEETTKYLMYSGNYATFIFDLIKLGILEKEVVLEQYTRQLSHGLWIFNNVVTKEIKDSVQDYIKFCNENKIEERKVSEERMKHTKFTNNKLSTLTFSSDEKLNADIYRCPICTKMFGTKDEFSLHIKENSCKKSK